MRWALPEWTIAVVSAVLTFAAALSVGWWVALPCLLALPPLVIGLRWYLARAKDGYLAETASYSQITTTLSETVEGSRTVEALGLGEKRVELGDDDCAKSFEAEKYTLHLRTVFFPSMELSYLLPVVGTLLFGGWLYTRGDVSLAEVTTATLYVQMLIDPVDRIVSILDELQLGAASLARLLGVAQVPDDREVSGACAVVGEARCRRTSASPTSRDATCCTASTSTSAWASGSRWSDRPARASPPSGGSSPASTRRAPAR